MKERRKLHSCCRLIEQLLCQLTKVTGLVYSDHIEININYIDISRLQLIRIGNSIDAIRPIISVLSGFEQYYRQKSDS
jgi:hypothetical protein